MLKAASEIGTKWMTAMCVILWWGIMRYMWTVVRVGYWMSTTVKKIPWHTAHVMQLLEQAIKMFERVIEEGENQHHPVRTYGYEDTSTDTTRQWQKK